MKFFKNILVDVFIYDTVLPIFAIAVVVLLLCAAIKTQIENNKVDDMFVASIEKTFPYAMHQSKDELLLYRRLDTKLGTGTYVLHVCSTAYHPSLRYVFHSTNATDVSNCELCDYEYDAKRH